MVRAIRLVSRSRSHGSAFGRGPRPAGRRYASRTLRILLCRIAGVVAWQFGVHGQVEKIISRKWFLAAKSQKKSIGVGWAIQTAYAESRRRLSASWDAQGADTPGATPSVPGGCGR